jgi:nicotinamidase-related amidase
MSGLNIPGEHYSHPARRRDSFAHLDPRMTALAVVDMQNYFVAPGYQAEIAAARDIVPAINRATAGMRAAGALVIWVLTTADGADRDWSNLHAELLTPLASRKRLEGLAEGSPGFALWPELDVAEADARVLKRRYSAFLPAPSPLERLLRDRAIDTLLVAGTATNVCCDSTARDAMMLDFRTAMLADANAARSADLHEGALANFQAYFGVVWTVDEALARLTRTR